MKKIKTEKNDAMSKNKLLYLLKALIFAYLLTVVIFLFFAILLTYTDIKESYFGVMSIIAPALSSLMCGYDFSKLMKEKGLLYGSLCGLLYAIIYLIIGLFLGSSLFSSDKILMIIIPVLGGTIGGVFGVNKR